MPTISLPPHPSLRNLRQQARALQHAVRTGNSDAGTRVSRQYPGGVPDDAAAFTLAAAQLVVAREYGFSSWPRMKQYVELATEYGWDASAAVSETDAEAGSPKDGGDDPRSAALRTERAADEFCRLACLTHSDDDPGRWTRARQLLGEHPDLTADHIWAAAAAGDLDAVRRLVREDPARARERGGPHRWRPLGYLAYSRVDPDVPRDSALGIARLLLDHGADPNEGYLWNGHPALFTVLTGVFGEGELGPEAQPQHPHALALARILLDAGADPNDAQTLYNRMFQSNNEHLELLFEYGLGTGDGGPWKARLGDVWGTPTDALRDQLRWAVNHDFLDRVRLLADHGVDVVSAYDDGRTPAELAHLDGHTEIVDYLVAQGAAPPELEPAGAVVAATFRADHAEVRRLLAEHPKVLDELRTTRPGLIVWAAATRRADTVTLLLDLGFDVDARGRGDIPREESWQTALHEAAAQGNLELARLLLSRGASPTVRDARFDSTPLGWARHGGKEEMIALLEPVTADEAGT